MIIDMRCPACDCPVVRGSDEVIIANELPTLAPACPECGTRIRIAFDSLEPPHHYITKAP